VAVTDRGLINVDNQMRTNVPHKAVHEAHVAAEVIAGELQGIKVKKGLVPWTASGRAIVNSRFDAVTKLLSSIAAKDCPFKNSFSCLT
jgi:dihydrolipoamide dehydrogenase